jgi:hypothetical protein
MKKIRKSDSWHWHHQGGTPLHELFDGDRLLAWVHERPAYCDRGHWQLNVECVPDLDSQDMFPRYFMRFEHAQREAVEFLEWRLFKKRV